MTETTNFGLKKPEETDFYSVDTQNDNMDAIDSVLQEFKDGTQQVGDSAKLGGKDASEYALIGGTYLTTSILEYALTLSIGEHFIRFSGDSYSGNDLPLSNYKYGTANINKRGANAIEVILWGSHAADTRRIAVNFYNGSSWTGWDTYAKTSDLANYLPLSGGTVSGNIEIVIDTPNQRIFRIKNSVKDIYLNVNASGEFGLYDNTLRQYVFKSDPDGARTFNGTASGNLPLNGGGKIQKSGYDIIELENTDYYNSFVVFRGTNGRNGAIGFLNVNRPAIMNDKQDTAYDLLHTGNSAKVAIQETAPTDGLWVW